MGKLFIQDFLRGLIFLSFGLSLFYSLYMHEFSILAQIFHLNL